MEKVRKILKENVLENVDLVLLPELWNTGFDKEAIVKYAEVLGEGETFKFMENMSREHGIYIAGSIPEKANNIIYNTMVIYGSKGELEGYYRKIHLFKRFGEDKVFSPSEKPIVLNILGTKVGFAICYDIRFPELTRILALKGAELLAVIAAWGKPRVDHWRNLLIARAIENQFYVIALGRTGKSNVISEGFPGHSIVVDPWGKVLVELDEEERVEKVSINLDEVKRTRRELPVLYDARIEDYAEWYRELKH